MVAGCVGVGGSPGPSAIPSSSGSPTATVGPSATGQPSGSPLATIEHRTGPTDVILRMATGGGFVAPGVLLTEIPEFTLYGDGTVVYRDPATSYIEPSPSDGVARRQAFQTAKLSEAQVQAILADAIGPGGLGTAEELYTPCCIADAPSTTFTLRTTDLDKTVTVGALGFDSPNQGADAAARTAFQALAKRLVAPDLGTVTPATYVPAAYRGILYDAVDISPSAPSIAWPWATFGPDGFTVSSDPGAMQVPTRTLSADDVAALSIDGLEGGADSMALKTSDGKIHVLAVRPLLPDERS
jgi:hypothetical protein